MEPIAVVEAAEVDGSLQLQERLLLQYLRRAYLCFVKDHLIANRGGIAMRIIHSLVNLASGQFAVYSTADKALHTFSPDGCSLYWPAKSTESYLNMVLVRAAAVLTGKKLSILVWIFK